MGSVKIPKGEVMVVWGRRGLAARAVVGPHCSPGPEPCIAPVPSVPQFLFSHVEEANSIKTPCFGS